MSVTAKELKTELKPDWCPGCGDFAILNGLKSSVAEAGLQPHNTLVVSGIGCSSKLPHWIKCYGFHTLHGRSLPVAQGVRMANHELDIIVISGDGDGYGIGMGHLVHAMRRNMRMAVIVHNNQTYGLTTGQTSPTSDLGYRSKSTPLGNTEVPVNPIALGIIGGATFVARAFAGDVKHMNMVLVRALKHTGFALVDVFQPCVTFNKVNTYDFFRSTTYRLEDQGHDPKDKAAALTRAVEHERLPIGVFYEESRPTYEGTHPALADGPLVKHDIADIDLTAAIEEFF
ncbi:MAG TPA: 2-oxoacid:ferredoxin oxidoreductase subunit beta [Candidatus Thermoplasmatota archaeon]